MSIPSRSRTNPKKLLKYLKEGGYQERAEAAFYLGELGDAAYYDELKNALQDPVPHVVKAVVEALQKLGMDEQTKEEIAAILKSHKDHEEKLNSRTADAWKEKTEEEKQEELERFAAHAHIREAKRENLKVVEGMNRNWVIAVTILGLITLLIIIF